MDRGRSFSTGVGLESAPAPAASLGRNTTRQALKAAGHRRLRSAARRMTRRAPRHSSGCSCRCSAAIPSRPAALPSDPLMAARSWPSSRGDKTGGSGRSPPAGVRPPRSQGP
eukprot:14970205-Alexandrium_andersonii.AAC.1